MYFKYTGIFLIVITAFVIAKTRRFKKYEIKIDTPGNSSEYTFYKVAEKEDHESSHIVQFKVKASRNVRLALSDQRCLGDGSVEIILGNRISVVHNTKKLKFEFNSNGILNESTFHSFWVQWHYLANVNGKRKLIFFVGRKGHDPFINSVEMKAIDIKYFGISTGDNAVGNWILEAISHKCYMNDSDLQCVEPNATLGFTHKKYIYDFRTSECREVQWYKECERAPDEDPIFDTQAICETECCNQDIL